MLFRNFVKEFFMKRVISVLLLAALTVTAASCGNSGTPDDTKSQDVTTVPNDTTTAAETEEKPDIPESGDYSGYEFRVLYDHTGWGTYTNEYIDFEAQNGDVYSDAAYNRNRLCEEKFGFKLVPVEKKWGEVTGALNSSIMAGDDDYDLAIVTYGWAHGKDLLIDFNTVPHIDTSKPWWNTNAANQMEVNGALTNALSDFIITHRDGTVATFFNKKLADDYKLGNLYDLVREGKWTLDKFAECAKGVSSDLDGDNEYTDKDMFGYSALDSNSYTYMYFGAGMRLVDTDKDGKPTVAIGSEQSINVLQKISALLNSDNIQYCPKYNKNSGGDGDQSIFRVFQEGRALFLSHGIGSANRFRNMEVDFGVLPAPKYDEEQESYWNVIDAGKYMVIPKTATDLDRTGTILESLSYEGYKSVIGAYYDTMLKNKLMRDDDSIEMLDKYIFPNSAVKSFFYASVQETLQNVVKAPDSMSSTIASSLSSMQENINKVYETFIDE